MATIATTLVPEPEVFALTGIPQPFQTVSAIPRAEVYYKQNFKAIALSGVGDDQLAIVSCILPKSFSYVLMDCFMDLQTALDADMADWDDTVYCLMRDAESGATDALGFAGRAGGVVSGSDSGVQAPRKIYDFNNLPRGVIIPKQYENGTLTLKLANPATNDAVAYLSCYIRLLQFDIAQSHHYEVNAAIPTR